MDEKWNQNTEEVSQSAASGASKTDGEIHKHCARAHEHLACLALPWDEVRPFVERGWERLSGVIAPRDTDRGLRGGI